LLWADIFKKTPVEGVFLNMSPEHNVIITLLSNREYVQQIAQQVAFIKFLREGEKVDLV